MKQNDLAVSRRWLIGASGAALLAAGCSKNDSGGDSSGSGGSDGSVGTEGYGGSDDSGGGSAPDGVLGGNFNEDPTGCGFTELEGVKASWLRGFVAIRDKEETGATQDRAVSTLLNASEHGYGTILSLKLPHNDKPFPDPDSSEMDDLLAKVDKVLDTVMDKVNILVVGNEPFIESRKEDWNGPLGDFYEKVAEHVLAYRAEHSGKSSRTRIYMGALNHLDEPEWRGEGAERWMEFARKTDGIEGVDIHPHVSSMANAKQYLDFVVPRLGDGQKFLVTEFSLVQLWRQHMKDPIPRQFAERYKMSPGTKVWEAIKQAIDHPWSQRQWQDLLAMSPWYASHKHWLSTQVKQFRDTGKLAVATYGVAQGAAMTKDFGPKKPPWLLNSLYASRTARPEDGSSTPAQSLGWYDDFRALQRKQDKLPVNTGSVRT
ncbi:hypothetical protein [Streptomyces yatensis]|uniref:hypothetical protein n=1 Tax=Streptomyces yatensis TaxID=155177 RepID=UPI001FE260BE|nr:hypothetical protein [Streptomyces yatensis]